MEYVIFTFCSVTRKMSIISPYLDDHLTESGSIRHVLDVHQTHFRVGYTKWHFQICVLYWILHFVVELDFDLLSMPTSVAKIGHENINVERRWHKKHTTQIEHETRLDKLD